MKFSLAYFQMPNLTLPYLDPYNNTFGENSWFIILMVILVNIVSIIAIFLMLKMILFEKSCSNSGNYKLLDRLISFNMLVGIIFTITNMILMTYRNLFGPFDNLTFVMILVSIQVFGRIAFVINLIKGFFVWYLTEKVMKNMCHIDLNGMVECIHFFTIVLSAGITLIIISCGQIQHDQFKRFTGLPLDFTHKFLYDLR